MRIFGRLLLLLPAAVLIAAGAEPQQTKFIITRPTLISFFLDYTDEQIKEEGGEALADFVFYLPYAESKLRSSG